MKPYRITRVSLTIISLFLLNFCLCVNEIKNSDRTSEFIGRLKDVADEELMDDRKLPKLSRSKRFLLTPLAFHLFGMMRMSPSQNYVPAHPTDYFDVLRDSYPLPSGVYRADSVYDYVVIGAGTAGSVVASRLSEDSGSSVLLLEAGGPEGLLNDVPLLAAYFLHTDYNWGYTMEKHEGLCLGMEDQRCNWPKGKAVGGTSVINYMIYTRGGREDWDRIAALGNPGWSYDDVLPYYLKTEKAANLNGLENSAYHNKFGLLSNEYPPYKTPMVDAFLDAAAELGNKVGDYNQEYQDSFSRIQSTTHFGRRQSTAKAYLHPFRHRRNLHILPHSRVTKINIKKNSKRAASVEYLRNKIRHKVKARKEIILSAGSLASPQLLMLSGIGPKQHLEELGIPVIKDLPVGQTMYDHICFPGLQFLVNCTDCTLRETSALNVPNTANWLKHGDGPFTIIGGVEGIGYIKTNVSTENGRYPDMEMLYLSGGLTADESSTIRKSMRISDRLYQSTYASITEKPAWSIFPMIIHPKSKGYLKLKDSNPFHWPKFYYDYFSDRRDMDTMIEGIKYAIKMSKTRAFQKYGSKLHKTPYPNCKDHKFGSDRYWECALRTTGTTLHHQIATCKMGPKTDPEAVVDHELRVYGINNLRVVDASIIPKPLSAHTNIPTVMVAEKASDMIKKSQQKTY